MNKVELSHLQGTTKVPGQEENAQESEPGMSHTSGNGSGSTTPQESQILAIEPSDSRGLANRKATGPRTEQGKQRASRNATKHGVFSKVVVLKGESRAEYEKLLAGLREALHPEGALEELLVEKLATFAWRHRRLLLAESAEIRKNKEFVKLDQVIRNHEDAEKIVRLLDSSNNHGLVREIHNPEVLKRCLELLAELREQIEKNGFNPERDRPLLEKIYGDRHKKRLHNDLYDSYDVLLRTSEASAKKRKGFASPAEGLQYFMQQIDDEIRRLERRQEVCTSVETARTQLEILRHNVPDARGLDRLLRYETSLDRLFDRTLSQLERLQRMRRGQPVPPPLKVEISGLEAGPAAVDVRR